MLVYPVLSHQYVKQSQFSALSKYLDKIHTVIVAAFVKHIFKSKAAPLSVAPSLKVEHMSQ